MPQFQLIIGHLWCVISVINKALILASKVIWPQGGSGKFIKWENQECSSILECPWPTWTKPNLHGRQTWSNHETFYNLFLPSHSSPWVHIPKLAGHNCPTKMVLPLRLPARNWQCYAANPVFYTSGHKLVSQVVPLYSCVHLYTRFTVCIAQLSPSWIEQNY